MSRKGKCTNFGNCVLAYRGEQVSVPDGPFVCPECKKPLTEDSAAGVAPGEKSKLIPMLIGAGILAVLVVGWFVFVQTERLVPPTAEPAAVEPTGEVVAETAVESTGVAPAKVVPATSPASAAPADAAAVPDKINLDAQDEVNSQVKGEVLKRIDLMPTISQDNKDKLYFSVERARQMGKIIMIPFEFGQRTLDGEDTEALQAALALDRIKEVLADPTAVLVVIGYADTKGDEEKNLKISEDRAKAVVDVLKDKLRVLNVMHAIGMGSSTLFDPEGNEKNRVVEVWVVLP